MFMHPSAPFYVCYCGFVESFKMKTTSTLLLFFEIMLASLNVPMNFKTTFSTSARLDFDKEPDDYRPDAPLQNKHIDLGVIYIAHLSSNAE